MEETQKSDSHAQMLSVLKKVEKLTIFGSSSYAELWKEIVNAIKAAEAAQ